MLEIFEKYISPPPRSIPAELLDKNISLLTRIKKGISSLSDSNKRLFVCDCAERVLIEQDKTAEKPDSRSWSALDTARDYASGIATDENLSIAFEHSYLIAKLSQKGPSYDFYEAARIAACTTVKSAKSAAIQASWVGARYARNNSLLAEYRWQLNRIIEYLKIQ